MLKFFVKKIHPLTLLTLLVLTACSNATRVVSPTPTVMPPTITPKPNLLYLGQAPPGVEPIIFAPGIVSDPEFTEYSGAFSPDGNEYYFYRFSENSQSKLLFSKMLNDSWTEPEELSFSAGYGAFEPYIGFDNKRLYFAWTKPAPSGIRGLPSYFFVERTQAGWSEPKFAGQGMFISSSRDGQFYTTDMSSRNADGKTYLAKITVTDGVFTEYDRLPIETPRGNPAHPCIAPDGSYIIFDVENGNYFFVSFRNPDGTWGEPIDLTKHGFDPMAGGAYISPDGEYLFFALRGDIWWVDISVIEKLRPISDLPSSTSTAAQTSHTNTWVRPFEGSDYGAFFDITLTPDGNAFAVGTTNHLHFPPYSGDALFMKLTLEGNLLWEKTWGGDGYEQAWAVTLAEDGGYYVFGETDSYGAGDRDFFLLKITEDGTEEWYKTYGYAYREWPYGMLQLSNGDLLIYGFTESEISRERNQYVLRLGKDGSIIWEYTVESPEEEFVLDALETAEGDLVLAVGIASDGKLVKLDENGQSQWEKRYDLPGWQFASQVAQSEDGGFLLAGFAMVSRSQADTWFAHCTSTGEMEWETSFGNPAFDDYANSMIQLKDGTYLIGKIGNGMLLTRINKDGDILWDRSLIGTTVYGARSLIQLEDGGFLVAGFIQIRNGRSYDAILLRTDADGLVDK